MSNRNNGLKVLIGLAIGTAVGAAIAYLSDEEKRNKLIDDMSDTTDRMGENIKDAYYEGRIRARKAGRDLSRRFADFKDNASSTMSDVAASAKSFRHKAKDAAQNIAELTEEELASLKDEAVKKSEEIADKL
ncbi:MAG: YtxH domain-containing protein [Bacteroidales bacterium]|nr:YtxH domain-containing protein [Bacteroidales bacterium]